VNTEDAKTLESFAREMIANTTDRIAAIDADIAALKADRAGYENLRAKHQAALAEARAQQEVKP